MLKVKPYVVCMHKDNPKDRFALDRHYLLIPDHLVAYDQTYIMDAVQITNQMPATFSQLPDWTNGVASDRCITMWFSYYDQR